MVLPIPDWEPRLQRRYQHLVKEHLHTNEPVAAGPRALPGVNQSFASTQAAWRFYANPRVTLEELATPLMISGRELLTSQCRNYGLIMHDWSDLHYGAHTRKTDRIPLGKDQGYQLETALLVSDRTGLPLTPLSLSLWAADGIHTTRCAEVVTDHSHLDELTATINALETNQWSLPLVHISDRESDSISHLRDWDKENWRYVVRAKALPSVVWESRKMRLVEIADHLTWRPSGTVQLTAAIIAQQMIAETEIVITRPGQRRVRRGQGRVRNHEPGAPLRLRLIVVRLLLPDNGLAGEWLLLTNLGQEVSAEMIAEWYYWRWIIESYFKLCKSAGQHLEEWQQETAPAIAKRLLIAAMACIVVWQIQRDDSSAGAELRQLLLRLSGRQVRRGQATAPALLSGMWVLLAMLDALEHYDLAELKEMMHVMLPGYSFNDTG
jgi:Transposase DDE domain